MTLPAATLDHVVINARDDMDRAADIYRRLGFTLTERGYHSLGSINHLAMFGTDYLELIAVPKGATTGRMDLMAFPFGLNGLVFGSEDSAVTYESLAKVGVRGGEAVVIGDTRFDAEAARKAGATPIGVLCGGFPEADLRSAGCVEMYYDPEDLLRRFDTSLLRSR